MAAFSLSDHSKFKVKFWRATEELIVFIVD